MDRAGVRRRLADHPQVEGKPNRANSDWVPLGDSPITTTSFSHTNSQTSNPIKDYGWRYRVQAVNSVGGGAWSDTTPELTGAVVVRPAREPTATAVSDTRIDLSWTVPAYDGGQSITGYRIEVSFDQRLVGPGRRHRQDRRHLQPYRPLFRRQAAINAVGTGTASNVAGHHPRHHRADPL